MHASARKVPVQVHANAFAMVYLNARTKYCRFIGGKMGTMTVGGRVSPNIGGPNVGVPLSAKRDFFLGFVTFFVLRTKKTGFSLSIGEFYCFSKSKRSFPTPDQATTVVLL